MEEHTFENSIGYRLAATLYRPSGPWPFPVVVFAHGLRSSRKSPRSTPIAQALAEAGIAAFRFDFTGHGDSEGTFEESTLLRQVDDLKCAVAYVRRLPGIDGSKWGINGASSGGAVAVMVAAEDPPSAMVLRGPRLDDVLHLAERLTSPTLILQGELDPLLPVSGEFYRRMTCKKDLRVVKGADHVFGDPRALLEVERLTVGWFRTYLS